MSSKKGSNIFHTFAFRLTVWHAVLFFILLVIVFTVSYQLLMTSLIERVDRDLTIELKDFDEDLDEEGFEEVREDIIEDAREEGIKRIFFRLLSSDTTEIVVSDISEWKELDLSDLNEWAQTVKEGRPILKTVHAPEEEDRSRVITGMIGDGAYILQMGMLIEDREHVAAHFNKIFFGAGFLLLICTTFLGWFGAKKAMDGVQRVTDTAVSIGTEGFSQRVQLKNEGTEIDRLADAFNNMLDRIESLMMELKDITNNIAHDLRTPLTRIRGIAETTVSGKKDIENYRKSIEVVVEECDRLIHLINTTLEIAELDTGLKKVEQGEVDVAALVKQGYELFLPLAQDKQIEFKFETPKYPIMIRGNTAQIQRVISNLFDNAIKYTEKGGQVDVSIKEVDSYVQILVKDTGIGISTDQKHRIFEKFYRIESARSTPGNGLGLSLVKSIIYSMGGNITVDSVPGKGSAFLIEIPSTPTLQS